MWGKNAGLIYSDKPSQYFQYVPYHMDMDDWTVTQVIIDDFVLYTPSCMSEYKKRIKRSHELAIEKGRFTSRCPVVHGMFRRLWKNQ